MNVTVRVKCGPVNMGSSLSQFLNDCSSQCGFANSRITADQDHRAGYEAVESEAGQAPAAKLPPGQQETSQEEPEGSSGDEEELVE